eukprot:8819511-Pyramimonas_sp.AAC.1
MERVSCQTWKFARHNVVQAPVIGDDAGAPVLFCISCGASAQHSHRPGKGLAGPVSYTHLTLPTILLV